MHRTRRRKRLEMGERRQGEPEMVNSAHVAELHNIITISIRRDSGENQRGKVGRTRNEKSAMIRQGQRAALTLVRVSESGETPKS